MYRYVVLDIRTESPFLLYYVWCKKSKRGSFRDRFALERRRKKEGVCDVRRDSIQPIIRDSCWLGGGSQKLQQSLMEKAI